MNEALLEAEFEWTCDDIFPSQEIYFQVVGLNVEMIQTISGERASSSHAIVRTFAPFRGALRGGDLNPNSGPVFKGDRDRFVGSCVLKRLQKVHASY